MTHPSFQHTAIVACGTLSPELNHLVIDKFLNTPHLYYTRPGLHRDVLEMESQLTRFIGKALKKANRVIVVYGGNTCCAGMEDIVADQGMNVVRVAADHCMGMLAEETELAGITRKVAGGKPVLFMTPGWIKYHDELFGKDEHFSRHTGGAVVLDGIGYLDRYMEDDPGGFRELQDRMGIPMQAYPVTLDRLKTLLTDALARLKHGKKGLLTEARP